MADWRSTSLSVIFCCCLSWPLQAAGPDGDGVPVAMLYYQEQEPGTDVYPVRVLVSDRYVRIDDGDDRGDYVLLDRKTRRVSGVNHAEQNILVIEYRAADMQLPADLQLTETETVDAQAPRVQGRQPVNRRLLANGELCRQVVTVPDLLDDAVRGLIEYAGVLGARQLNSMDDVPDSLRTPCFLARYAYAPARHLAHGLPLQEWDEAGYRRSLVDFSASERVSPALFSLPAGYTEFSLE